MTRCCGKARTGPCITWPNYHFSMNRIGEIASRVCAKHTRWRAAGRASLETRRSIFIQHDGAQQHFGRQNTLCLNQRHENRLIGRCGTMTWPPRSPDLIPPDLYLWSLMKCMAYRTKVNTREELLHRIIDTAAYIREHHKMICNRTGAPGRTLACT
jgi:hypothetical protein